MRLAEDEGKQETPEPLDGLFQADLPVSFSLLLAVLGRLLHPALPGLVPAIVADGIAQGQQGIDVLAFPMHACAFESSLDHEFVGAFDHAGANRPSGCLEERVLHLGVPLKQILPGGPHLRGRAPPCQAREVEQHPLWPVVFEAVQHAVQPASGQAMACLSHRLAKRMHVLSRMGKIQDANRIGPLLVDKALQPLRTIGDRCHLSDLFHPSPMCFQQRGLFKASHVGQP